MINAELAERLRALFAAQPIASLGTLHDGAPFVSMVPYALLPNAAAFVIHVSGLAAHTKDMVADPRVSLMVMAVPDPDGNPQALARVTVQGEAVQIPAEAPILEAARAAYLARFPSSAQTFELGDFALFAIRATSARFVGGFAQAKSLSAEGMVEVLQGATRKS
jgi:putative heme iron utilization protein